MIEMRVDSIQLDPRNMQPILVLCDEAKMRALPIWIGSAEANAIARVLLSVESPRPKTHHLLSNTIKALGSKVDRIEINELEDDTFYATVMLKRQSGDATEETALDARPSDAVALALIENVPILVAPSVVLESTYPVDAERDEAEANEFKSFLQKISASDFAKHAGVRSEDRVAEPSPVDADDRDAA
jgi:bifunctional DNase/RNase